MVLVERTACSSASLSHPLNFPNSELTSQCLRYRTSSTSQTAIPTERLRSTSQHPFFYLRVACRGYTTSRHRVFANCQKSDMIDW